MAHHIDIRESGPNDVSFIEELYPRAFPGEDLLPLVRALLADANIALSLVAMIDAVLVGHVVFTTCRIAGTTDDVALLGPLAVAPEWQRQGAGGALVRSGMQRVKDAGASHVFVLGDPAYYERFGFQPDHHAAPPYPLPDEWRIAWRSLSLRGDSAPLSGELSVPGPWRDRALWGP